MKTALLAILGILILVVVLGGGCMYQGYNRAIQLDEAVKSQWSQVENQLQRRYDLIPNLVETVKGVAQQEKDVFLGIANARKAYFQADTVGETADAVNGLERALSRLLVLRETYPELKSNESFLKLQDELAGSENRVSVERMRYNEAVRTLNTFTRQFPSSFFASFAGVGPAEYFEIDEAARTAPKVDFKTPEPKSAA
jgi:LemA protein